MRKAITILMVFAIALATFSVAAAATPAPGGPFNTDFKVQNLETAAASCSYIFYDSTGAAKLTSASQTVQPGDAWDVYVPSLTGVNPGSYSAVVTCDKKVASVANFSDPNSGSAFAGISDPGTSWFAPVIYNNYYNYYTTIIVQNATAASNDITVDIFTAGSTTPVKTQKITGVAGYASVSFEQEGLTELLTNKGYSAKITGTGDIAPIVNIYGKGGSAGQLYSYNPFKAGSAKAYAPVIMNNYYTYNTSLVIQNLGAAAADFKVTYSKKGDASFHPTATYNIGPGASKEVYTPSQTAILPAGNSQYGATVEAVDGVTPLALIVNESNPNNRASSYAGFAAGSVDMRGPIIYKNYYKYNTSVTCMNVGSAAAVINIAYAGISGSTKSSLNGADYSVNVGEAYQFYQPADPLLASVPANYQTSATITSAQPVACVVNEDMNNAADAAASAGKDFLYTYNTFIP